jgi:hypothetical protein
MGYVEYLRLRTSFVWHVGILAALTLVLLYFIGQPGHIVVHSAHLGGTLTPGMVIPLSALTSVGVLFAAIFASTAGASLNRENPVRDLSWTKPVPRARTAWVFIAVDVAAILVYFALALAAAALILTRMHIALTSGADLAIQLMLGVGVALMWYALIALLTCGLGPGARMIGGILWPISFVLLALDELPNALGQLATAIDVLNPLAYSSHVFGFKTILMTLPIETRALAVWVLAAVFSAAAVTLWTRKEA